MAQTSNRGWFVRQSAINDHFLDSIGEEQAWLLGLLASDGSIEGARLVRIAQSHDHGLLLIQEVQRMLGHTGRVHRDGDSYGIKVSSPVLVRRLAEFNIVPRKSLVYTFPDALPSECHAAFIRGYVEGDGSAGIYELRGRPVPMVSFVGTPAFIARCAQVVPVAGHIYAVQRARNLAELRFNGEKALAFGDWVWASRALPRSTKQAKIAHFLAAYTPRYAHYAPKKARALELLAQGWSAKDAAAEVGVPFQTVHKWRATAGAGAS